MQSAMMIMAVKSRLDHRGKLFRSQEVFGVTPVGARERIECPEDDEIVVRVLPPTSDFLGRLELELECGYARSDKFGSAIKREPLCVQVEWDVEVVYSPIVDCSRYRRTFIPSPAMIWSEGTNDVVVESYRSAEIRGLAKWRLMARIKVLEWIGKFEQRRTWES